MKATRVMMGSAALAAAATLTAPALAAAAVPNADTHTNAPALTAQAGEGGTTEVTVTVPEGQTACVGPYLIQDRVTDAGALGLISGGEAAGGDVDASQAKIVGDAVPGLPGGYPGGIDGFPLSASPYTATFELDAELPYTAMSVCTGGAADQRPDLYLRTIHYSPGPVSSFIGSLEGMGLGSATGSLGSLASLDAVFGS